MSNYVDKSLVLKRLKKYTTVINGCWLFHGYVENGYGRIKIKCRKYNVSRLSLAIHLGLDYDDWSWQANHTDNCTKKTCWNPAHLYKGTHSENMLDTVRLGTHAETKRTHCPKGHLLDGYRRKYNTRYCLTCNRERVKSYVSRSKNA